MNLEVQKIVKVIQNNVADNKDNLMLVKISNHTLQTRRGDQRWNTK